MLDYVRRDAARYRTKWFSYPGFWITAIYRLGNWAHRQRALLRIPVWVVYRVLRLVFRIYSVDVWAGKRGARIGPGLCLIHPMSIIIGKGAEIGEECLIFHDVTIGTGPTPGVPKIGNNVDIYAGARVLGGVVIGDGVMIGANCVVTRDVPAGSVVVTAPCRVIPRSLSAVARAADGQREPSPPAPPS